MTFSERTENSTPREWVRWQNTTCWKRKHLKLTVFWNERSEYTILIWWWVENQLLQFMWKTAAKQSNIYVCEHTFILANEKKKNTVEDAVNQFVFTNRVKPNPVEICFESIFTFGDENWLNSYRLTEWCICRFKSMECLSIEENMGNT